MRNIIIFLLMLLIACSCAAEGDWSDAPVITDAYETGDNELYLEWDGDTQFYRVYLDEKEAATVYGSACVIQIKGDKQHRVTVCPLMESENEGKINIDAKLPIVGSVGLKLGSGTLDLNAEGTPFGKAGISIDVSALGFDPKKFVQGNQSETLTFTSRNNDLASQVINDMSVYTDDQNRACLTFTDYKNAEEYIVYVEKDKNVSPVVYSTLDAGGSAWISRDGTTVTITLDPEYLMQKNCMVPKMDNTYTFSVQLRNRVSSLVTGEKVDGVYYTSKKSKELKYTLMAPWKTAPVITFASQTADGQIRLEWKHNKKGLECSYGVYQVEKTLVVKTGEKLIGTTSDNSFVISDLLNGSYTYVISAQYGSEEGEKSEEATVEVKNSWQIAPKIACQTKGEKEISITWEPASNIEAYRIIVYLGDEDSLLRYTNMDFQKTDEAELAASGSPMEYVYLIPDGAARLKFEVYGVRHAADGSEQKSAVSSEIFTK